MADKPKTTWYSYYVRCQDSSLYAGITTNLSRRVKEHNGNKLGAKYTKTRQPVTLVYFVICDSRSEASKQEIKMKKLSKTKKELLVLNFSPKALIAINNL